MMDTYPLTAYTKCSCGVCYKLHQIAYSLTYTNRTFRLIAIKPVLQPTCRYCKRVLPKPIVERKGWK